VTQSAAIVMIAALRREPPLGAAILYPGTAFFDPQFVTPHSFPLGIALQLYIEIVYLTVVALASWLAPRRRAHCAA
jgi:hypothetical protein